MWKKRGETKCKSLCKYTTQPEQNIELNLKVGTLVVVVHKNKNNLPLRMLRTMKDLFEPLAQD